MAGDAFTWQGKYAALPEPTRIRPAFGARRPNFYGAIGSAESAGIMGDLGLPPLCLASFPDHVLRRILESWRTHMAAAGRPTEATIPISVKCFVAETDEAAREQALRHLPEFFALQVRHYQSDHAPWGNIEGYQQFNRMFANLRLLSDPANLDGFLAQNMIGSPETVARRARQLASLGFNYFVVSNATYGVPRAVRHRTIRLFAEEVVPRLREDVVTAAE
jgi:alkanesulfonate monooxygenase SsuD/methylene tetrahydromethanopterin reductase-like flavin-dependent oxidoreductase (luciferase family)